jgi:hypothetical protein
VNLGDIFELMVQMVIVEFQRADRLHLLLALLVDTQCNNLLLMLNASVLLSAH